MYAIAGGGQWGARAVATALLDSMYETWPSKVAVLDMEEAVEVYRNSGLEEVRCYYALSFGLGRNSRSTHRQGERSVNLFAILLTPHRVGSSMMMSFMRQKIKVHFIVM